MTTKLIKDLVVGDVVALKEPEGKARVSFKESSRLFRAEGGCWRFDFTVIEGPHKGERIKDQHHVGADSVEVF